MTKTMIHVFGHQGPEMILFAVVFKQEAGNGYGLILRGVSDPAMPPTAKRAQPASPGMQSRFFRPRPVSVFAPNDHTVTDSAPKPRT